jgi:hypothetical protein
LERVAKQCIVLYKRLHSDNFTHCVLGFVRGFASVLRHFLNFGSLRQATNKGLHLSKHIRLIR